MSIITRGLDITNSRVILQGYYDYLVEVEVVERPAHQGGAFPIGFPSAKGERFERDITIRLKRDDEKHWHEFFIENVDERMEFLVARIQEVIKDEESSKKITFHIKEKIEEGDKKFSFSVKEVLG